MCTPKNCLHEGTLQKFQMLDIAYNKIISEGGTKPRRILNVIFFSKCEEKKLLDTGSL